MAAGGPSGHHDPLVVAAERGQFLRQKIDAGMNLGHDLIERHLRRQRVADQRNIDAIRQWSFGKQRKGLLCPLLPVAAVYEQKRGAVVARLEKVDPVALARAVAQVEMIAIARPHLGRALVPAGDDVGAAGDRFAIVEAAVAVLLAHAAPVQRVERRAHAQISDSGSPGGFPLCRKLFYRTTLSAIREAERLGDIMASNQYLVRETACAIVDK